MHTEVNPRPGHAETEDQNDSAQSARPGIQQKRDRKAEHQCGVIAGKRRLGCMVEQLAAQSDLEGSWVIPDGRDDLRKPQADQRRECRVKQHEPHGSARAHPCDNKQGWREIDRPGGQ